jgi:hypothetical protein
MMSAQRFASMWVKDAQRSQDGNKAELVELWFGLLERATGRSAL